MPRAPVCPFYGHTKKERLVCLQGGADTTGQNELTMHFPNQMCRVRYWVNFCCGDWKRCTLASALWEEYEKENGTPTAACTARRAGA